VDRTFNLQVFLEDDTLQITEIPQRNSGFAGGKFLSRSRQHHPDGSRILPGDIRLGGTLQIQSFQFLVLDADDHSLKYMECNSDIWKESSLQLIAMKLHDHESALRDILLRMKDKALEDISYDDMRALLKEAEVGLSIQETLTLLRAMDKKRKGTVKYFRLFRILNDEDLFSSWEQHSQSRQGMGSRGGGDEEDGFFTGRGSYLTGGTESEYSSNQRRRK
jgi:hypothetical protein